MWETFFPKLFFISECIYLVGIWSQNDVVSTSMQRIDVAKMTSYRRRCDVIDVILLEQILSFNSRLYSRKPWLSREERGSHEICTSLLNFRRGLIFQYKSDLPFRYLPAGTWRRNDVVLTSMRRDFVAWTSKQRHFDVMCLLGFSKNK